MSLSEEIEARLVAAFPGADVHVRNDSARHAGHTGDDGSGESHWHVSITSAQFSGQNLLARHRSVHAALGKEIIGRIHALGLDLKEN